MTQGPTELRAFLAEVKRRWAWRSVLRAWTLGTASAAVILLAGFAAIWLLGTDGLPLAVTAFAVGFIALAALLQAFWPLRRSPSAAQLARLVEERVPDLDDLVVTAVDAAERSDVSPRMRDLLSADAGRALGDIDLDRVVDGRSIRHAALQAAVATLALGLGVALFAPALSRATSVATAYLFPARLQLEVQPGSANVRAGDPLTIAARLAGVSGSVMPTLSVQVGDETRALRMEPTDDGRFTVTIERVTVPFEYRVTAGSARSDQYAVQVIRPPHVERIDLHYQFPKGLGLAPRTDEDSGDIYGPAGTDVRVSVTADKPIASAALVLEDGTRVALDVNGTALTGGLTIEDDGSYRIALVDRDGLEGAGDTEYFIRTLDDRPPDVRIVRPASDKHVTALEEVAIEARADDDYGIASFELVFQTPSGRERTVPLSASRGALTASARHTLFMEELGVAPGDFVTYYARARDVNRGRRSTESRSDIFFLEVKPFEEEFVAAQSQAMGQGGGMQNDTGLEALVEAQKEIIVATWKLDARGRRARDRAAVQDIKAVSKAQGELRSRTEQASARSARANDPRRRRAIGGNPAPSDDPIGRAVEAMGRAVGELDKPSTSAALPHEMEALNQLLRAMAEIRRRQVTRGQQAGGGGGANRSQADLSSLFDQELRRRQQTNYETPNSTETREERPQDDLLERIRELARRQDALNRQHQDLAQNRDRLGEAELRRQLERLTREQNDLRQQAEQLARQLQPSGQRSSSGQQGGQSSSQDTRQLRDISEDMRNAASGMRRQDSGQASASGARAAERLREFERQMQTSRPDDRRRALGDVQLETRQLADAQRRLANEAERTSRGVAGDDARRRLAGEQERLAERTERLQDQVNRLSKTGQGQGDDRRATDEAARALAQEKLAERMRQSAESLRQATGSGEQRSGEQTAGGEQSESNPGRDAARQGEAMARALDRVADRLGAATGNEDRDSRRLSDQLGRTQELRDRMANLERSIEELRRQAQQAESDARKAEGSSGREAASDSQTPRQGPQQAQSGPQGQGGQQSASGREGSAGQQGGSSGGNGGRLQQLQRDVNTGMREAERLAGEIRQQNPGMQTPNPEEGWWRSFSAPGTEAFKQDFARWESLKRHLLVALESVESNVSDELRARENSERLNAGGHEAVDEAYREMVDRYYRSLAAPRKPR